MTAAALRYRRDSRKSIFRTSVQKPGAESQTQTVIAPVRKAAAMPRAKNLIFAVFPIVSRTAAKAGNTAHIIHNIFAAVNKAMSILRPSVCPYTDRVPE